MEERGANDLFLLVCRWCDKSQTPVAILRAAWPAFADPPDLALCGETGRHHPVGDAFCIFSGLNCIFKHYVHMGSEALLVITLLRYIFST